MSLFESDEPLMPARERKFAKHEILEQYLKRWFPILATQPGKRLLYVDGFAAHGEYAGGAPGSPLVAIEAAVASQERLTKPVRIVLIEKEAGVFKHLKKVVDDQRSKLAGLSSQIELPEPIQGDCETEVNRLIDEHQQNRAQLGPAFFFLDQFGYSQFSIDLIARILRHPMCETFSFLNWLTMHPWLTDPLKAAGLTKAMGGTEWQKVIPLSGAKREQEFRDLYITALKKRAHARYVYPFEMRGSDGRLLYWLFFCTNNIRGLEVMKTAMWKVDSTGSFTFQEGMSGQFTFFAYTDQNLAEDLYRKFRGQKANTQQVREYVLVETPHYRFGTALQLLERRKPSLIVSRVGPAKDQIITFAP